MKSAKSKVKALRGRIADINAQRDLRARFAKSQEDLATKAFANLSWLAKKYSVVGGH